VAVVVVGWLLTIPTPSSTPSTSEAGLPEQSAGKSTLEGDFGMTSPSDVFNELSVRVKKTEGVIEARVVRDREWLRARLDMLESAMDQAVRAGEQMVSARVDVETEWGVLQASLDSHFAAVRAKG
jgi:hypothetical protein